MSSDPVESIINLGNPCLQITKKDVENVVEKIQNNTLHSESEILENVRVELGFYGNEGVTTTINKLLLAASRIKSQDIDRQ